MTRHRGSANDPQRRAQRHVQDAHGLPGILRCYSEQYPVRHALQQASPEPAPLGPWQGPSRPVLAPARNRVGWSATAPAPGVPPSAWHYLLIVRTAPAREGEQTHVLLLAFL